MKTKLIQGDCIEVMASMKENSIDAIITDPPYGLEYMAKEWDKFDKKSVKPKKYGASLEIANEKEHISHPFRDGTKRVRYGNSDGLKVYENWCVIWAKELIRIAKPGANLLCFGGTRTWHRLCCVLEDAGWIIRENLMWIYGQGFPKSLNISKALDVEAGAKREKVKMKKSPAYQRAIGNTRPWMFDPEHEIDGDVPITELAKEWDGFGSCLKPAFEPIILAMKPLDGTFAENVKKWGVGGLNIEACRIGKSKAVLSSTSRTDGGLRKETGQEDGHNPNIGRYPSNVIFSHHELCNEIGEKKIKGSFCKSPSPASDKRKSGYAGGLGGDRPPRGIGDSDNKETIEVWECAIGCPCGHTFTSVKLKPCVRCGCRKTYWVCPLAMLNEQSGEGNSSVQITRGGNRNSAFGLGRQEDMPCYGDFGGASRFFYVAKASRSEREAGLKSLEKSVFPTMGKGIGAREHDPLELGAYARNTHPTVKPVALLRYLVKLSVPKNGILCDPFVGSGTTLIAALKEGHDSIGIEKEEEYINIAKHRIHYHNDNKGFAAGVVEVEKYEKQEAK